MVKRNLVWITGLALAASVGPVGAQSAGAAPDLSLFTGDTKLACEAVLCLSSGTRPSECNPSLQRYFGIVKNGPKDDPTPVKRLRFLKQCPASNETPQMQALVAAMSNAVGTCTAEYLNMTLKTIKQVTVCEKVYGIMDRDLYDSAHPGEKCTIKDIEVINNKLPRYCSAFFEHEYIKSSDTRVPIYVGQPEKGGKWIN